MKRMQQVIVLLLVTLTMVSCQMRPQKKPAVKAGPNLQSELRAAEAELKAAKSEKSLERLTKIITNYPDTDVAHEARFLMGRIYYDQRDFKRAAESFLSIVRSETFSPDEAAALWWASQSMYRLGRFDEALSLLNESNKIPGLSQEMRLKNQRLSFVILNQIGDRLDALQVLIFLSENETSESAKLQSRQRAIDFVQSRLSSEDLAKVSSQSSYGFVRPYAYLRLGRIQFDARDFRRSRSQLTQVMSLSPGTDLSEQAQALIDQIDARRKVDPKTVGLLLPLSGKHEAVGRRILRGMQLGLGIYGPDPSDLKLAVIDSEGNPDQARRAVERLVTEDFVIAIAGPLLSRTATAAASKADELGVPTISLTQKTGITQVGETVFRNALTSEMQVRELVRVSMQKLGYKNFAVLYPNDPYGVEFTNLFWDEVLTQGGSIRAAQTYDPKETNLSGPIKRMVGTYYLEDRKEEYKEVFKEWLKKHPQRRGGRQKDAVTDLLKPIRQFDAVFVPDTVRAVAQIAPTFSYFDVSGFRLLGTNLWNSESFVNVGQRHVEGAILVDQIDANDENFQQSRFFMSYRATFGEDPGNLEAQGYDTGLILRSIIESGETTRAGVTKRLKNLKNFQGALGTLYTNQNREIERPLVRLTVEKGKIRKM